MDAHPTVGAIHKERLRYLYSVQYTKMTLETIDGHEFRKIPGSGYYHADDCALCTVRMAAGMSRAEAIGGKKYKQTEDPNLALFKEKWGVQ